MLVFVRLRRFAAAMPVEGASGVADRADAAVRVTDEGRLCSASLERVAVSRRGSWKLASLYSLPVLIFGLAAIVFAGWLARDVYPETPAPRRCRTSRTASISARPPF